MTPEGKVKARLKKMLDTFNGDAYVFMPVQNGYGASTIDYLMCFRGLFIGIETKRPGGAPTPRQEMVMEDIRKAGGSTFVVSCDEEVQTLEQFLHTVAKWG